MRHAQFPVEKIDQPPGDGPAGGIEEYLRMYQTMYTIRRFEETVVELSQKGDIAGAAHMYIGQEAIAAGVCMALAPGDYILSTHRGHGHCIAKGGDLKLMMAELLGRSSGYCKGKGGSMHIVDPALGILGANGIVGGGLPISVGAGLSSKMQNNDRITICFFGDGACNEGSFHESLNLASIWKAPVLYVCENNQFAISTHFSYATATDTIAERASAYGMAGRLIDGNDVLAVYKAAGEMIGRIRQGAGPMLLECRTYRIDGHYIGDPCVYRDKAEVEQWRKEKDPLKRFKTGLVAEGILEEALLAEIEQEVEIRLAEAVQFAESSPDPAPEEVAEDVFCESVELAIKPAGKVRELTFREAVNEALSEELENDSRVFLLGEDIGVHGGGFAVTKGLYDKFGADRVRDTPISEIAIVGAAIGAAITGLRPVAEIMYIDFAALAMDQIVNQAAKLHYMFGGKTSVPMVIRMASGSGGRGNAAQHSQSLEAWFMHAPGLKVVMPSTPFDAKGLLKAAIRDQNPVIFIEHKVLYNTKGEVPEGEYTIPFGVADIKRAGSDLTIIATSRMVVRALEAARELEHAGVCVEIVDPRTLVPLDADTIVKSVKKTGKALVVTEDCRNCGAGAELAAVINEHCFDYLDGPVTRLSGLDVPIPYNRTLEGIAVPSVEKIVEYVSRLV